MSNAECASLALCVLIAGAAGAAENPDRPAAPAAAPAEIEVPNIPKELMAPPPAPQPSSDGIAPDPAASSVGLPLAPVQLQAPTPAQDDCDTADCPGAADRRAIPGRRAASPKPAAAVHIGVPAQRALSASHNWAENPLAVPTQDPNGRVIFAYSESAPTIVCAPIHVCDIELQEGEVVQGAPHVGDAIRWRISPAVSGSEDRRVTHLIVKPTEPGLDTNLIIPTDRHTYHLRLVSSVNRYVSSVGFYYPEEQQQEWAQFTRTATGGDSAHGAGDMPNVAVNRLNFNYRIKVVKGKPAFKPLRAMDDGYHTYIAMNEEMPQQEAPALIGISRSGDEQMINYRLKGNMYVVDGTVFKLALVSGVGRHQERVELTREPCERRGWLGSCWDPKE